MANRIVETSSAAAADTMGAARAQEIFINELKNGPRVMTILSPEQQNSFKAVTGRSPAFEQKKSVTHDHPLLAACRELVVTDVKKAYESSVHQKRMVIGCGGMEIGAFGGDAGVTLHFHASESKDAKRIIGPAISEAARRWRKGLSGRERRSIAKDTSPAHKKNMMFKEFLRFVEGPTESSKDYAALATGSYPEADVLFGFDMAYNLGGRGFADLFKQTKASMFHGTMLLPEELVWDGMSRHPWYVYSETPGLEGQWARIGYRGSLGGYSNGYQHLKSNWAFILNYPQWVDPITGIILNVEITSRVGPMVSFSVWPSEMRTPAYRMLSLPSTRRYVRVFDPIASYDGSGRLSTIKRFAVSEEGFASLMSYAFGLKDQGKELNALALEGYIRRHMWGIAMGGNVQERPWDMEEENVVSLACVAAAVAYGIMNGLHEKIAQAATKEARFWKVIKWLGAAAAITVSMGLVIPAKMLWDYLTEEIPFVDLIQKPSFELHQTGALLDPVFSMFSFKATDFVVRPEYLLGEDEAPVESNDELISKAEESVVVGQYQDRRDFGSIEGLDKDSCWLCKKIDGKMGKQIVRCSHGSTNAIDLSMTAEEVTIWKSELIAAAESCPIADLKTVLEKAYGKEGSGNTWLEGPWDLSNIDTYCMEAGPGTGKSTTIRTIYDDLTLIVAPFSKLRGDYMQVEMEGRSDKVDMAFKTTHNSMYYGQAYETYICDEATAIDRRAIATALMRSKPKRALFFFDRRQTGIRAEEGKSLFENNSWPERSMYHELLVNFRNDAWTVAYLNKYMGYNMIAWNQGFEPWTVKEMSEAMALDEKKYYSYAFTKATGSNVLDADVNEKGKTVRSMQGSTVNYARIPLEDVDPTLVATDQLWTVAVSRHRHELVFGADISSMGYAALLLRLHKEDMELWGNNPKAIASLVGRSLIDEDGIAEAKAEAVLNAIVAETTASVEFRAQFGIIDIAKATADEYKKKKLELEASREAKAEQFRIEMLRQTEELRYEQISEKLRQMMMPEEWNAGNLEVPMPKDEQSVWESTIPGLGRIDTGAQHLKMGTFSRNLGMIGFFESRSWCALVAMILAFDLSTFQSFMLVKRWYEMETERSESGTSMRQIQDATYALGAIPLFLEVDAKYETAKASSKVVATLRGPDFAAITPFNTKVFRLYNDHIEYIEADQWMVERNQFDLKTGKGISGAKVVTIAGGRSPLDVLKERNWLRAEIRIDGLQGVLRLENERYGVRFEDVGVRTKKARARTVAEQEVHERMWTAMHEVTENQVSRVNELDLLERGAPKDVLTCDKPTFDAYAEARTSDISPLEDRATCSNEVFAAQGFVNRPRGGHLHANYNDPVSNKFKPIDPKFKDERSFGIGTGNWFFDNNASQMVQSAAGRYLKRGVSTARFCSPAARRLVRAMVSKFVKGAMAPELLVDEAAEAEVWNEWLATADRKKYMNRMASEGEDAKRYVNYFCKAQYKPTKGKAKPEKVGQGISAWSAQAVLENCGPIRIANLRFQMNLKDNVIFDNGMSEEELAAKVAVEVADLPMGIGSCTTDVAEMDAMQCIVTQEVEKEMLRYLGFDEGFIAYYYQFRSDYPMTGKGVFACKGGTEKTSGEPGTLLFNTIVSAVFSYFVIDGKGKFVMLMKGDDNARWQIGLRLNDENYKWVKQYTRYRAVINFGDSEFCGKVVTPTGMYPSLVRMQKKAVAHRFRRPRTFKTKKGWKTEVDHFCEYQESLRNKINFVADLGEMTVIMSNASTHGMSYAEVSARWDIVKSLAHVSVSQIEGLWNNFGRPSGNIEPQRRYNSHPSLIRGILSSTHPTITITICNKMSMFFTRGAMRAAQNYGSGRGGRGGFGGRGPTCTVCGRVGHTALNCWNRVTPVSANPSAVCGCCGAQGHGRADCLNHIGSRAKKGPCCRGGQGTARRTEAQGPTVTNQQVVAASTGVATQPTSLQVVQQQAGQQLPTGAEARTWSMVLPAATFTRIGTTDTMYGQIDVSSTNVPRLAALLQEYERVHLASVNLEVVTTGAATAVEILYIAWVGDSSPTATNVQELDERTVVRSNANSQYLVGGSLDRHDTNILATARTRSGLRLRMFYTGHSTFRNFDLRLVGSAQGYDRIIN